MAVWRRRALELFPQLRRDLSRGSYSPYSLFDDLRPLLRQAHDDGDNKLLRSIYSFAEWCARQTAKELWNPAEVSFYEHLFDYSDYSDYSERVIPWLSLFVVYTHWELWEAMVTPAEWVRVSLLLRQKQAQGEGEFRAARGRR